MKQNSNDSLPLIQDFSNLEYVNSYTPGGILLVRFDESFTILEANQGYFQLVGYTAEEIRDLYQNKGLLTLHPQDGAAALLKLIEQVSQHPEQSFSVISRLVNKFSGYKTVQFSGRVILDENGEKYVFFLLIDVTAHMDTLNQLIEEQDFNAMIATLTDNVFFDYNLNTSVIRYSKNFADRLGVPQVLEDYPNTLINKGVLTQENYDIMKKNFLERKNNQVEEELCFRLHDGRYIWYLCHYQVLENAEGKPYRVVGKMVDISYQRLQIDELTNRTLIDQQTGIYNKNTTESLIREYLENKLNLERRGALFIIDIDNFKKINDVFGHMFGDKVLVEIADTIKKMFREDDIIGRLGGDEFFVFMKDYRSVKTLEEKAMGLCKNLWNHYSKDDSNVQLSASIGIALYPQNGVDFTQLYEFADIAMYTVKTQGKNNFIIYNGEERPNYKGSRKE